MRIRSSLLAGLVLLPASPPARLPAQDTVNTWVREHYSQGDVMIPMPLWPASREAHPSRKSSTSPAE